MDTAMKSAMKQVARERSHMVAVRHAFAAALNAQPKPESIGAFYGACVDYLDFIMERFRKQDRTTAHLILSRIPDSRPEHKAQVAQTLAGIDASEREMAALKMAAEKFRAEGQSGQAAFEAAGRHFVDYFTSHLSKLKHATRPLSEEFLKPGEFERSCFVTEASIVREQDLFAAVESARPPSVPLDVAYETQHWRGEQVDPR